MLLTIIKAVESSPFAPTVTQLHKLSRRSRPPAYFTFDRESTYIDIEHKSWLQVLKNNALKQKVSLNHNKSGSKKDENNTLDDEMQKLQADSLRSELLIPVEKLKKIKLGNEQVEIEILKQKGSLIPYDMANWLFLSFMESTNTELLRLPKKLEADIINLCRDNSPLEIIQLYSRQTSAIIQSVKEHQKKALKEWSESLKNNV